MRRFEWLLAVLLALAAVAVVIGLLLPSQLVVSRAVVIDAPPARVYTTISDVRRFETFLPWGGGVNDMDYSYPGPTSGVGARVKWQSTRPGVGSGSLEVTAALEDRRIEMQVSHDREPRVLEHWLQLRPLADGTRVEWGMRTDFGWDLIGRYTAVLFDDAIGAQLARGLARLRKAVEQGAPTEAGS